MGSAKRLSASLSCLVLLVSVRTREKEVGIEKKKCGMVFLEGGSSYKVLKFREKEGKETRRSFCLVGSEAVKRSIAYSI